MFSAKNQVMAVRASTLSLMVCALMSLAKANDDCTVTDQNLTDVSQIINSVNVSCESVSITYHAMTSLPAMAFSSLRDVTVLSLDHGSIGLVDDAAFAGLALTTLRMSSNNITRIPDLAVSC